jgi:hypothetical protein
MENQIGKPSAKIIGQDGNIFNLIGIASRALKQADMADEAKEMQNKIMNGGVDYDGAIQIIMDYVEVE